MKFNETGVFPQSRQVAQHLPATVYSPGWWSLPAIFNSVALVRLLTAVTSRGICIPFGVSIFSRCVNDLL